MHLSIAAAKRVTALNALYELAGGELIAAQQRNYAKVKGFCVFKEVKY